MKIQTKLNIVLTAMFFVLMAVCGCVSLQIGNAEKDVIAKISARHIGFEIERQYPAIALELKKISHRILDADETIALTGVSKEMIEALTGETIDDPILKADIQDILSLCEVKTDIKIENQTIKAVATGLISGMEN